MAGKIDCYIDIASYYSYVAFADLRSRRAALGAHGVTIEFHPVLIGGVMSTSGNAPPWIHPGKSRWIALDMPRAAARVGLGPPGTLAAPPNFVGMTRTTAPLRALLWAKTHWGPAVFEALAAELFARFWRPPHANVSQPEVLEQILREDSTRVPEWEGGSARAPAPAGSMAAPTKTTATTTRPLRDDEVRQLMAATTAEDIKARLREDTNRIVTELAAFGLPWIRVQRGGREEEDEAESFFGSDRLFDICAYLGVPCRDVEVLPPPVGRAGGASKL